MHLQSAISVHNATPHLSTGHSPYFMLFGCEPVLPGWQALQRHQDSTAVRSLARADALNRELCRLKVQAEVQLVKPDEKLKPGDWVVYWISKYEKESEDGSVNKYSSFWSLPAQVRKVVGKVCHVEVWGERRERQVPITQVRVLQGSVPPSLREMTFSKLAVTPARRALPPGRESGDPTPWPSVLTDARDRLEASQ
jgi:hypothetical protein